MWKCLVFIRLGLYEWLKNVFPKSGLVFLFLNIYAIFLQKHDWKRTHNFFLIVLEDTTSTRKYLKLFVNFSTTREKS